MRVGDLRNYGIAASDAESLWPREVKERMARGARGVIMAHLKPMQRLRFLIAMVKARRKARSIDLSDLRARGMTNERFLAQQTEYLVAFTALAQVLGTQEAVSVMNAVMRETAREPMLLCLPPLEDVKRFPDAMEVFREYMRAMVEATPKAGCQAMTVAEDGPDAFQFDVTWCVWLELARKFGVPDACKCNCYADDLVFPDYFEELGIRYRRTGTLAYGQNRCDFRFERMASSPENE